MYPTEAVAPRQPGTHPPNAAPGSPVMVEQHGVADQADDDALADQPQAEVPLNTAQQPAPPAAFQPAANGAVVVPAGRGFEGLIRIEEERDEPKFMLMGVPQHKKLPGETFDEKFSPGQFIQKFKQRCD